MKQRLFPTSAIWARWGFSKTIPWALFKILMKPNGRLFGGQYNATFRVLEFVRVLLKSFVNPWRVMRHGPKQTTKVRFPNLYRIN